MHGSVANRPRGVENDAAVAGVGRYVLRRSCRPPRRFDQQSEDRPVSCARSIAGRAAEDAMRCDFEEDVSALFDGELRDEEAARVRAHVETCAACRELLDDFESVRESVRSLHQIESQPRSLWRRRVTIPLPIAAAIAVLLLGAPFIAF